MKFLKKHFTKFIMAFTLAFTCLFVAFGCNTYAYTIDNNGNLVGDNLCSDNWTYNEENTFQVYNGIHDYSLNSMLNINGTYTFSIYFNQSINNNVGLEVRKNYGYFYGVNSNALEGRLVLSFDYNTTDTFQIRVYATYGTQATKRVQFYNSMLNSGDTAQDWEPYGIWYSSSNYDYVVNKYDNLLDSIYPFNKNLFSINNVEYNGYDITDDYIESYDYTIEFNGNAINFNTRDFDYLPNNLSSQGINHFFMVIVYDKTVTANSLSFKIDLSHTKESSLNISFYNGTTIVTSTGVLDNENSSAFYTEYNTFSFNRLMIDLYISADETQNNRYSSIVSGGTYSEGYSQASAYYDSQLSALSDMISVKDNTIVSLKRSINELQSAYNTLNQSYQNMLNGNNFANLFFTIAETPFASFKQIWNVDFLGVNLAGFVTGILFLGLIIWVIKKIF